MHGQWLRVVNDSSISNLKSKMEDIPKFSTDYGKMNQHDSAY